MYVSQKNSPSRLYRVANPGNAIVFDCWNGFLGITERHEGLMGDERSE